MRSKDFSAWTVLTAAHCLLLLLQTFSACVGKVETSATGKSYLIYEEGDEPTLTRPLRNVTVTIGRNAVFRCQITGFPSRVGWKKDGAYVPHTRRFRTRSFTWGGTLRIKNVKVSDYGLYTCTATNYYGTVTSNRARLNITGIDPKRFERCEAYNGSLCSPYIATNSSFIAFGRTQHELEAIVQNTFRTISSYISPQCKKYLLPSLCKHHFPPCVSTPSGPSAVPICKEDCLRMERNTCKDSYDVAKAVSTKLRYRLPICNALPKIKKRPDCQKIFSSDHKKDQSLRRDDVKPHSSTQIMKIFAMIQGVSVTQKPKTVTPVEDPVMYDAKEDQKLRGTCEPYVGKICSQYVKPGENIFIIENESQQGYETGLSDSWEALVPFTSTRCRKYALRALCYYFFPPCKKDKRTPHLICRRDCEMLEGSVCSKEFQYIKTMPIGGEIIPDCTFLPIKQDECLELGLPSEISTIFPNHRSCSIYAMGLRSQGKMSPKRPESLRESFQWCQGGYRKTSIENAPSNLREKLKQFVRNGTSHVMGHRNKGTLKYCIKLKNETPETLLNDSYNKTVALPNMIRPHVNVTLPGVVFKVISNQTTIADIPIGYMAKYRPHKYIELDNVHFLYRIAPAHETFVGRGRYHLCGTNFTVEIKRTTQDVVRINGRSSDPVDVNTIEQAFGLAETQDQLRELLKEYGFFLLRLTKPYMEMHVGRALSAKFVGTAYMEKFGKNARTEIIAGKLYNKYLLTAGLIFDDEPLGKFVSTFSGVYLKYLDMFSAKNGGNKIGLSLSAREVDLTTVPFMAYTSEPLASEFTNKIPKGLHVTAKVSTPKHCEEDETLCRLVQIVLGEGKEFTMTGETNWGWAHFAATIKNTTMKDHLPAEEIKIRIETKRDMSFHLNPTISYKVHGNVLANGKNTKKVTFTGDMQQVAGSRLMTGQLTSDAIWYNAFGYPQLTMKRMQARLSVALKKPYFPNRLEMRSDFEIGLYCKDNDENDCITGTAFVGMSDDITEQFFDGVISRFTIQDILRVHGIKSALPTPIGRIGFPDGLQISFARNQHNLQSLGGSVIKPGFHMKGKITMLGFESDCSVNLKENEFLVDADINGNEGPIKLGGVTPLYRSRHDRKHGPKLYLETRFSPTPYIKAHIDGYTRIFGIFDEIRILMTQRHFVIRLVTNIFQSFKVRINVVANYSDDLSATQFKARVVFIGGLAKLTRASSKHMIRMVQSEKLKLQIAKNELNAFRNECYVDARKTCNSCMASGLCKKQLYSCRGKLRAQQKPIYAKNAVRHFCQRLVRDSCHSGAAGCEFMCRNSSRACQSFDKSRKNVANMEKSISWINQVKVMILSEIFKVHAITFETKLTPDDIGERYVKARLDVTLFGKRERVDGIRLKFGVFSRLASDIARNAIEWYKNSVQ